MANLERNARKRTLNPKLSSTDNASQEAANLKRQKIQKGATTATTTSKKRQPSIEDSDEDSDEDDLPKQVSVKQTKNRRARDSSRASDGSDDDVEMLDGEASMPASSVIGASEAGDGDGIDEDSLDVELGIFFHLHIVYHSL
jgi:hypothetical protein